jgi:hypothetical protein
MPAAPLPRTIFSRDRKYDTLIGSTPRPCGAQSSSADATSGGSMKP